jgi:hypothetical protein
MRGILVLDNNISQQSPFQVPVISSANSNTTFVLVVFTSFDANKLSRR